MMSKEVLTKLRSLFNCAEVLKNSNGHALDAFILPSTDSHQSEYLSDYDFRVRFLSGFSGSNAYVIVTQNEALLFTDGRYFDQAEKELAHGWTLMKSGLPGSLTPNEWLIKNLPAASYVGFDPFLSTYLEVKKMLEDFEGLKFNTVPVAPNLVDMIWNTRPIRPTQEIIALPVEVTGKSIQEKLEEIRLKLDENKCSAVIFCALDDIMWTLNIRGADIPYNPLAYSYLLVSLESATLFIDSVKVQDKVRHHLKNIDIVNYDDTVSYLSDWQGKQRQVNPSHRVFVPVSSSYAIGHIFADSLITDVSPVQVLKAVKNPVEMEGMRRSHIRDSAALIEFFYWLEQNVLSGATLSEIEVAKKVDRIRAAQEHYVDLSFSTISAAGEHAALPHYHTQGDEGEKKITKEQVYLCDSGAHYLDGTTDVTRTVLIGDPSKVNPDFVFHNTLVLKGHISLAMTKFPEGILGSRLDSFTRHALWQAGLDFGHGTGHGVGHFLNVHEGPISIGYRVVLPGGQIRPGQVLTIEPGFYLPGSYGIRIENCYETVRTSVLSGAHNFLTFKTLTLVPIQTSILDKTLLTAQEVQWLNAYHSEVLSVVGPVLLSKGKIREHEWLEKNCGHI